MKEGKKKKKKVNPEIRLKGQERHRLRLGVLVHFKEHPSFSGLFSHHCGPLEVLEMDQKNELVLKYLTQINASIANLQTQVAGLEKSFAKETDALRRAREEDVRAISSRVAHIGTHVSYLRQNICTSVNKNVSAATRPLYM